MLVMKDSDYLTVEFVVVSSPKKKKKKKNMQLCSNQKTI